MRAVFPAGPFKFDRKNYPGPGSYLRADAGRNILATGLESWKQFQEPGGSVVYICMRCLLTVARARDAAELRSLPIEHICLGPLPPSLVSQANE